MDIWLKLGFTVSVLSGVTRLTVTHGRGHYFAIHGLAPKRR